VWLVYWGTEGDKGELRRLVDPWSGPSRLLGDMDPSSFDVEYTSADCRLLCGADAIGYQK
jgi:hypothetical protein